MLGPAGALRPAAIAIGLCLVATGCRGGSDASGSKKHDSAKAAAPAELAPAPPVAPGALEGVRGAGLGDLAAVGQKLDDGMKAYLGGQAAADAFAPWQVEGDDGLRGDLQNAGVTQLTSIGFEYEILFLRRDRGLYYLKTLVHAGGAGVSFLRFQGHPKENGDLRVRGLELDKYTGPAAPFGTAGAAVIAAIENDECQKLPVADPAKARAFLGPDPKMQDYLRPLQESRDKLDLTCTQITGLGEVDVRLRVDDHTYLAESADGTLLGYVRGAFEITPEGGLLFHLGHFRPIKRR